MNGMFSFNYAALISFEIMPRSLWSTRARCGNSPFFKIDHERLLFGISRWLLVCMTLFVVVFLAETRAFGLAAEFYVAPATGRIHDRFGRERIFHGLNVVMKGTPWHPRVDAFDPQHSFTDVDVALLKEWGMNVVRLGIMWPGVEPRRGHVNSTYLEIMQSIVSKLHSAGIYTLLEFHQDLYASQFCGEGLPSWILDDNDLDPRHVLQGQNSFSSFQDPTPVPPFDGSTATNNSQFSIQNKAEHDGGLPSRLRRRQLSSRTPHSKLLSKMRYPASFPEPLGRRWPWPSGWEKDDWEPSVESCNQHAWWWYYFSYAVSRAFQDLYDNKWGWGDLMARYWMVVAGAFKDQPGVLGYELMNEPWPGDVFSNPLLFLPGVADAKNLAHFYEKLQAAVRSVDSERILFLETITFDNFRCGWSTVPGGVEGQNKTVLSYHYYTPPNFSAQQAFAERSRESKRLGCGSMLTEFFVSTEQDKRSSKDFWEFRDVILNNAAGADDASEILRADLEAVSCDPAGKGSLDEKCRRKKGDSDGNLRSVKTSAPHSLRGWKEKEEIIRGDNKPSWSLEKGFESLEIDGKKSLDNKQNDQRRIVTGVVGEEDDRGAGMEEVEKVLENKEARLFTGIEKKKMEQDRDKEVDSVDGVLLAADVHVQSWIGWEYKAFFNKTGSVVQQSLFDNNGEVNLILAKKLARTYPQAVCGNINSFSFDPISSLFSFSYIGGSECRDEEKVAATEIFVHRDFYYPHGLFVSLNRTCASFSETDSMIVVKHTADCFGLVIDIRISRLDLVI